MSSTPTHGIILAAGLGTRMRPLTLTIPKPLVPVKGKKLIDYNLDFLRGGGIDQVVVNTSYLADLLEHHLRTRHELTIHVSREEPVPLETGGGILKALPLLGSAPFISMNSDAIFPVSMPHPIAMLCNQWRDEAMDFLMVLVEKHRARGLHGRGDFLREEHGCVRRPSEGEDAPYIFTGLQMIHPRVFVNCPTGAFSLNTLWQRSADARGVYQRVHSIVLDADWLHVGDLEGLSEAEAYLQH